MLCAQLGCEKPAAEVPKPKASVRLRAFVEAGATRAIVSTSDYLFVAMHEGLDRIHHQTGERLLLNKEHGLPGNIVYSMAADPARGGLWIATEGGITRLDLASTSFAPLVQAPEVFQVGSLENSVMAAASDGGLWLGTTGGLFYAAADGSWSQTGIASKVSSLLLDTGGTLWIGAEEGLLSVGADRVAQELDADSGCDFVKVVDLSQYDEQNVLVLAQGPSGESQLVLAHDQACTTYSIPDGPHWTAIASSEGRSYLLSEDRLQVLGEGLVRDPLREALVVRTANNKAGGPNTLELETMPGEVPSHARVLAVGQGSVFIGTPDLGVLKFSSAGQREWIRRRELVADASQLSVACNNETDCFMAIGTSRLWHWDGANFVDEGDARISHFVIRLEDGRLLLLRDAADASSSARVELFLRVDGQWQRIESMLLEAPGQRMQVRTVRQAPDGLIWVSLAFRDGLGDADPFGVAALDLEMGTIWYHRASFDEGAASQGILPVPVDVSGIAFLGADEIWLASSQGATRVVGDDIKTHIEPDGLLSEVLSAVVCSSGGMVYTASARGMGQWDGKRWRFPVSLRTAVHDLAIGKDGSLWLATDHGIGIYDGARTRRLDVRRGLLENVVLDLEADHVGRIWALGEQGLVLITP